MSSWTFLLLALSCSSSRSTTARLIGDVCFSVLKIFHSLSDLADTHADISIHTTKSLVDDFCQVSLFHKKFHESTMTKHHEEDSHLLAVNDGKVRGVLAFMLENEDAANGPVTLVTIFMPTSS
jgi:hypothetical protein